MEGLLQRFQRDLNRVADADRNTRKRGLLKLLEDLPWAAKEGDERSALRDLVLSNLLPALLQTIADSVEKCRETTLLLIHKCLECTHDLISSQTLDTLVIALCARVNDAPFPEPTEELRLQVIILLQRLLSVSTSDSLHPTSGGEGGDSSSAMQVDKSLHCRLAASSLDAVAHALTRALADPFPAAKQACAELVVNLASHPRAVKGQFRKMIQSLHGNVLHQHSKTRIVTMKALGATMRCSVQDVDAPFKEPLKALFYLLVGDKAPSVRTELAGQLGQTLAARLALLPPQALCSETDLELITLLLLLRGDDGEGVGACATEAMADAARAFTGGVWVPSGAFDEGAEIIDAEVELRQRLQQDASSPMQIDVGSRPSSPTTRHLLASNLTPLSVLLLEGVGAWTVDSRKRFLLALDVFLVQIGGDESSGLATLLPSLLHSLGPSVRDEEASVRAIAERVCARIGSLVEPDEVLGLVLPRVLGEVPGGDTATARTSAIRVLTCLVRGFAHPARNGDASSATASAGSQHVFAGVVASNQTQAPYLRSITQCLSRLDTYGFPEPPYREALLLLVRSLVSTFPNLCVTAAGGEGGGDGKGSVEQDLCTALLFLHGREGGDLVVQAAASELSKLAGLTRGSAAASDPQAVSDLLGKHFSALLAAIAGSSSATARWEPSDPRKHAFEALVRLCPRYSWKHWESVLPFIESQVQPPVAPGAETPEGIAASYAAQRGEETPLPSAEVSTRLTLLALLEGLVRAGTSDWECGAGLAAAAEGVIKRSVVPNLVWRVGRVEATVRKVALAVAYALLRAGAAPPELLYRASPELVPLLASGLDDSDTSVRHMGLLCLCVIFERLKGAFGPQAVSELYPLLLKRLDDSSDDVRIEACRAIAAFIAASGGHYSGSQLDYSLDALFVHLDDPDPRVQAAVYACITTAATVEPALVKKKAQACRGTHRTPELCDRLLA